MIVEIEFLNDGTLDSLTKAAAPAIFLSNLHREYARSRRENREIAIISLQWKGKSKVTEPQLMTLVRRIFEVIRSDEFFTRISESGFWIFLIGSEREGQNLVKRIFSGNNYLTTKNECWRISIISCPPAASLDEWIAKCDQAHFDSY
jgi:hypothetical protein